MPDAIITATESTFGTISGTFSADQSTVTGTVSGVITGTLDGSVGVPGPAGPGVPAGGTAGQYLQKIDGTNYNTDWVTLNLAAYAPLAGATFTGVVGFNGASGNVAAKSTGYFKAYTSGSESTDYSLQYDTGLQVVVGGTTVARIASSGILAPSAGITFSDATTQTSAGITAATAASTYYLQTNPAGYITSAALSGYATESFVTSQGYITSSALTPYLTTATAASTYFTIASAANKADIASPTFTGVPAAPTASPGTDTTQLATTAFVQQEVPDFAAITDVNFNPTSSTLALNPSLIPFLLANGNYRNYCNLTQTSINGSAAVTQFGPARELYTTSTTAAGRSTWMSTAYSAAFGNISSPANSRIINWSKHVWVFGVAILGRSSYLGNANTTCRVNLGGRTSNATGSLTTKGIGFFKVGGTSTFVNLTVHNGTTLTNVATSVTVASDASVHYIIYSDGAGNVQLYLNGTLAASTSAGPTGDSTAGANIYEEQLESATSSGALSSMHVAGAGVYIQR